MLGAIQPLDKLTPRIQTPKHTTRRAAAQREGRLLGSVWLLSMPLEGEEQHIYAAYLREKATVARHTGYILAHFVAHGRN